MDLLTALFNLLGWIPPIFIFLVFLAMVGGFAFFAWKFLVIKEFLGGFWDLGKDLFALVVPKQWDSAKTLILLGAFSWGVSLLIGTTAQSVTAFVGWIFLIAGMHWVMYEEKELTKLLTVSGVFLGPWITGALICYFLFGSTNGIPAIAFVLWPCISAIIAGIPKFIGSDAVQKTPIWVKPKPDDRQYLVNLALINLVLSCWIQLGFTTRQWLADYPTLENADFSNSAFVVQTQPNSQTSSRGVEILSRVSAELKKQLQGQSWSQVERWLLDLEAQLQQVEKTVMSQMPPSKENAFWTVTGQILPGEYNLQLFTVWHGPAANVEGFHFTQTCQISRVAPVDLSGLPANIASALPQIGNAKVQCSPVEGPIQGQPQMRDRGQPVR